MRATAARSGFATHPLYPANVSNRLSLNATAND